MAVLVMLLAAVALAACYLYLICPNLPRRDMRELLCWDYAHRGLWNEERPENSMAAFIAARDEGFGIELDVHRTSDGFLVVHHDNNLKRMCGVNRKIAQTRLADIRSLRLLDTDEVIPTLDEVLAVIDGQVPLIIELKVEGNAEALCKTVMERMARYEGAWCMESFDPRAVRWFRKNAPEVIRGQLAYGVTSGMSFDVKALLLHSQIFNVLGRPDFIAYKASSDDNLPMRILQRMQPWLVCWTVRSQEEMDALRGRYDLQIFEGFVPRPTFGHR